jgi:CHAT domain-containing protein/Tfp pilus assembly protein PilF
MKKQLIILLTLSLLMSISEMVLAQTSLKEAQKHLDTGNENKALQVLENSNEIENPNFLNLLGEVWLKKGNGEKAIEYFEKAKALIEKEDPNNNRLLGKSYNNIAVTLWSMGKSSQALQYHQVALQYREKLNDPLEEAASLNNIGLVYSTSQPDLAIEYYNKAKSIYENATLQDKIATAYVNMGLAYSNQEEFSEALNNLNVALDIRLEINGKNSTPVAFVYSSLASVFLATNDYRFAEQYAQKALTIYKQSYGSKHPEIATMYNLLGSSLLAEGKFKEAINSFQQAIVANLESFSPIGLYEIPPREGYLNADIYLVSILQKAKAFEALHTQFSLKIKDLELSYNLLILADKIIDNIRQFRTSEADKIALGNVASDVYEAAIRVSLEMAEVKWKKLPYQEKAFYFADKSKSAVLLEAIADANAQSFAGIPGATLSEEKEIKGEIAYLEQKLAETANEDVRKPLTAELLKWNQTYDSFKKTLEANYPDYFSLKYNIQTPSLAELQAKLQPGTTMVSYFIGSNSKRLYVFFVTPEVLKIENLELADDLNKNMIGYRNSTYYKITATSKEIGFTLFTQLGLDKLPKGTEQLIVVPSGRISTIPLEALITDVEDPNSYLINKYPVSYLYAASLMQNKSGGNKTGSVALFAPVDFSELGLSYLPGTRQEVEEISQLFESNKTETDLFIEENASKSAVTSDMVARSKIIHFATHGIVDEVHPERSQICLTTKDGSEGSLYTGDIYNLTFDADLVVLSACETGLGKLSKGEGIIGLTRAIIYSGANNMVVSLWSVADNSTSQLMIDFYSNMLSGQDYSLALANAKRKMITNGDYSKSYYWAPFVLIGY